MKNTVNTKGILFTAIIGVSLLLPVFPKNISTVLAGATESATMQSVYLLLKDQAMEKKFPETVTLEARLTDNTIIRPPKGQSVDDNIFGTRITRINVTDDGTGTAIANYPKVQSWNKDMSLLRIGNRLYDANSMQESAITQGKTPAQAYQTLCSRSSDYFRWSNMKPDRFFVMNSSYQFIQGTITGNTVDCTNILDSFAEFEEVHIGPHEGNIDYNDQYVVFSAKKPNDAAYYIILFDIPGKTRVWTKVITDNTWVQVNGDWQPSQIDWVSVSPSGRYIVVNENDKNEFQDGLYRYDLDYTDPQKLQYDYQGTLYSEGGHGDMGFDMEGNEVYVQFLSGLGVYSFNLDNPNELGKELLTSPYGGGHVSCRNSRRQGWCYVTTQEEGYKQVFALKLDGTANQTVQNFSQSHIHDGFPETYGAPSPDGTIIIFNSNWDNNHVGVNTFQGEIDTYIATAQ